MLNINRKYLNQDYRTDIITFDFSMDNEQINADIYISPETIRMNSRNLNLSFRSEIQRVMIHGVLHLCGYNDKSVKERILMKKKEDYYLDRYSKELDRKLK